MDQGYLMDLLMFKKIISPLFQQRPYFFPYVFFRHSAAMLKVRRWFNCDLSLVLSHPELWAWACSHSLFIAAIGRTLFHTFRNLLGPPLFSSFFFVSHCFSASAYFIGACADARQSEDTGDKAVTCCLHLALHHQQLRLQIYFPADCAHRSSW